LAAAGLGNTLNVMKRHAEAHKVLEDLLTRHGDDADLLSCTAEAAIAAGDPDTRGGPQRKMRGAGPARSGGSGDTGDGLAPAGR
jgi:hypothetical protein